MVRKYKLETVLEEIEYISKRSKNPTKLLMICDANFGMFDRDIQIAEAILDCKAKYDFPSRLYVYTLKNILPKTMQAYELLSSMTPMSMSLQSVNPRTLKAIGRTNIRDEHYAEIVQECKRSGIRTYCELIYGLPEEDYASFAQGVREVLKRGQERIQQYAHVLYWGGESATSAYRKRYGLKTAYRFQRSSFGTYKDISAAEIEEVVIGTNEMSVEDYFKIRKLHFFILLLTSHNFKELRFMLKCIDSDIVEVSEFIIQDREFWPDLFLAIMNDFHNACDNELIYNKEDLKTEFTIEEVNELQATGLELAPIYICRLYARKNNIIEFREYLAKVLTKLFRARLSAIKLDEIIESLHISMDRAVCYDDFNGLKSIKYPYDIDAWLANEENKGLFQYRIKEKLSYQLNHHNGLEEAFAKALKVGSSLEQSVYLLKYKFFPYSDVMIFYYPRTKEQAESVKPTTAALLAE